MFLPGIKMVTFDVTNTLLKFRMPPYDYYAIVAREHGFKGTGADIKNQLQSSYRDISNKYPNFGRDSISWKEWWSRIVEMTFQGHLLNNTNINVISKQLIKDFETPKCWEIADGSIDLIKLFISSGVTVGVISNFDPRLHDILSNLNINRYFEFVITSYEVGVSKPNKEIFECALCKYKRTIQPQQCLHIGDDVENDYNGAKAAGWHALLINDGHNKPEGSLNTYCNIKDLYSAIETNKLQL